MRTIKGPAVFLAQFAGNEPPYDTLDGLAAWAARHGYLGVQLPSWDKRIIDLEQAADSQDYCDEVQGRLAQHGLVASELASHLQGQLVAAHPAYDDILDGFAPAELRGRPAARRSWAETQLCLAARASRRLGIDRHVTFSGGLLWPFLYPYPQWPDGLIESGFRELAARWRPILDGFDEQGVDLCYELHPSEDLHDGLTFEMFLEQVDDHPRCNILYDPSHFLLQALDYLAFIDIYCERIKMFHVKDAELRPDGRRGVYGGFQPWLNRAGRFRSLGDGQIDFSAIFSKLAAIDFDGWAVLEWECCLKHPEDGAAEGARFIKQHIIRVAERAFDEFAKAEGSEAVNRQILGLEGSGAK